MKNNKSDKPILNMEINEIRMKVNDSGKGNEK